MEKRFKVSSHVYTAPYADRVVILDLQQDSFIGLNPIATTMWVNLSQGKSTQDIIRYLTMFYSVDEQRAISDLHRFIGEMEAKKLIEPIHHDLLSPPVCLASSLLPSTISSASFALQCIHEQLHLPGGFLRFAECIHDIDTTENITAHDDCVTHLSRDIENAVHAAPFRAACLHQSATLCWMLRLRNIDAHVVIGLYFFPLSSHVLLYSG